MDADTLLNPRAVSGDNQPPEEPTPFDVSKKEIEDLFGEAKLWLNGEPVESQAQADAVAKLIKDMQSAEKRADDRRTAENKPFDDGKAEVQSRYHPLIGKTKAGKGKTALVIETCKIVLDAFLAKEEAKKRAIAEEARREAVERQRIAQEAIRAADVANLAERQRAEDLILAAKNAERAATRAEKDKAAARGGGRAITSRVKPIVILADPQAALRHAREVWTDDLKDWLRKRAQQDVDAAKPIPPGFIVEHERSVA